MKKIRRTAKIRRWLLIMLVFGRCFSKTGDNIKILLMIRRQSNMISFETNFKIEIQTSTLLSFSAFFAEISEVLMSSLSLLNIWFGFQMYILCHYILTNEWIIYFFLLKSKIIFPTKYTISAPLMMENPVRSPMVPPIADNMSTNFAALSLVILSNVGESK